MITQDDIDAFADIDDTPLDMVREFTYSMGQPMRSTVTIVSLKTCAGPY